MSNITSIGYKGIVSLSLKIGDKTIKVTNHNAGTLNLMKAICKFLSGNGDNNDIPKFVDLRYTTAPATEISSWQSWLTAQISVQDGKYYEYDSDLENWVAKYTFSITHSNLIDDIMEDDDDRYAFRLYLYTNNTSSTTSTYSDLAYIDVSSQDLSRITPGTQAVVEWSMQVKNVSSEEE